MRRQQLGLVGNDKEQKRLLYSGRDYTPLPSSLLLLSAPSETAALNFCRETFILCSYSFPA